MSRLAARAAALLGAELAHTRALHGGDLSEVLHVRLANGREAIVKGGPAPPVEAEMLAAIGASGAPAPRVLAVADDVLVLEVLPENARVADAWSDLGRVLATLHAVTGAYYGWVADYAFGRVAISNAPSEDWPTFWGQRRLLIHVPEVPASLGRRIERLARELPSRLPARPRAALLHGDLWSGNVLVAERHVSGLVDPACYYGHSEVDLAMLTLFSEPSPSLFTSYGALEDGHAQRRAIYQLWPALVHLRLFGSTYTPLVERLLDAVGA